MRWPQRSAKRAFASSRDRLSSLLVPIAGSALRSPYALTLQVLKAEPGNAEALMLRSRAYFLLNDLHLAKRHLAEVLKYDDDNSAARKEFRKIKDLLKLKERVRAAGPRRSRVTVGFTGFCEP